MSIALNTGDPEWYSDIARWMLIDPQGNLILNGFSGEPLDVDLNSTGLWSLLVLGREASWEPVFYNLTISEFAIA